MKKFHVHLRVKDLEESIAFYNALFNQEAMIVKEDYAKWSLDDPKLNFAISSGKSQEGVEHLGMEVDSNKELHSVYKQMNEAKGEIFEEGYAVCCYAKSQKSWITDPQGVSWEVFFTFGNSTVYGKGINARPSPEVMKKWKGNDSLEVNFKPNRCECSDL